MYIGKGKKKLTILDRLIAKGIVHMNDGGEGGGGGDGTPPDPVKLAADLAASQASIAALQNKNKEILDKNKELSDFAKNWEGLDPANVRTMLERISGDEELKLIAEGKHDEVINRRTEKVRATFQSQLDTAKTEANTYKEQVAQRDNVIRDLMIDSKVVTAFISEAGHESAVPDVVLRAKQVFRVEEGEVIARDSKGELMVGKDGPMTIKEWVAKLKEEAEHLFPASQGSGAGNNSARNVTGIDAKIKAASDAGDTNEYRRLRDLKKKQASSKE